MRFNMFGIKKVRVGQFEPLATRDKPVIYPRQTRDLPMTTRVFFMGLMPFGFVEISRFFVTAGFLPKLSFLQSCLCCGYRGYLVSQGPNCKHSLEEHLWHRGTLTNAKIRVAHKPSKFATRRNPKICNWP